MTIRVAIRHNTYYTFDKAVNLSPHVIRLRPAPHSRTPIHSYSLKVQPEEHFLNWQQDAFGNFLASVVFPEKTKKLSIEVEVLADMTVINPFDFFLDEYAQDYPFKYPKQLKKDLSPYFEVLDNGERFDDFVGTIDTTETRTIDFLVKINTAVQERVGYNIRMEPGVQTPEETLKIKTGSCRDSAWLMVQVARKLGLASRFVSGYLVQLTADEKSLDGPSGTDVDFTDLHAWCEVFLPGAGWVGLDPTSGLFASEGHIPLACTPDPVSAGAIEGFTDKCEVKLDFVNDVKRVHEDPRVTKPYTDNEWQNILSLGNSVDKVLDKNDVRLTMGGEPTFVSIDDMESGQWNTEALGKDKLSLAKTLLLKMRDHFAPKGLLHYGQGKWYPGEELPRWALGLFWRTDGKVMWSKKELLARVDDKTDFGIEDTHRFTKTLSKLMALSDDFILPAYEDALHYLLLEQQIPKNLDTLALKSKGDLARRRLASLIENGMNKPVGFMLPLMWDTVSKRWISSKWEFKREKLILIPGDSPIGLRLPLENLPWEKKPRDLSPEDPFAPQDNLSSRTGALAKSKNKQVFDLDDAEKLEGGLVRTGLCIEPRDGKMHIFMPPMERLDDYVTLINLIEKTAASCKIPVIIEGYEPPRDPRIQKLLITPDPGVIEVNIHPSNNWKELVASTEALYKAARESRLAAEKFMLDGRHTGTGGGNHITLGGKTPTDSPILRRPDILRSLVTFWQHHPSLSYLFSGMFIGPTSQAPRADEGRDEALYEMEIAFQQMPDGLADQPWLVDRLMRNLLIDITGNTHRAEFCIDKLYSPSGPTGRLGILEFRGFEMPPHSQMALVQALLIRTLVARFWDKPYKKPLIRWGTTLHDKYMLPHYLWQDMRDVINDLNQHGFPFKLDWLLPFEEFRFPHYGRVKLDDIEIELRWAIEPWHVLGEEVGASGTSRYVDSSVERLQVKLTGLTEGRYILTCNGRRAPLKSTGIKGEFVAGIRYRAWAPPSALHPTLGVNTPLTFDLVDTWNDRSVGGCTYHVAHPGGLSYEQFPVNAFEAESRRGNRFDHLSHTQGQLSEPSEPNLLTQHKQNAMSKRYIESFGARDVTLVPDESASEYPHTLDLRRQPNWFG